MKATTARRLRLRFVDALPRKADSLSNFLDEIERGDPDAERRARAFSHQLAGSAGGYGFPELTTLARKAEHAEEGALSALLRELKAGIDTAYESALAALNRTAIVIEDDEDIIPQLTTYLEDLTSEVLIARTAAAASKLLEETRPAVVVMDLVLPDRDGRELLRDMRDRPGTANTPVVIFSGQRASAAKRDCIELGVDHYLEKPLDVELLRAAVRAALKRGSSWDREARRDRLTSLRNRAGFRESVTELQSLSERTKIPVTLALLDLDHFKKINDRHGHAVGDAVLRGFGALARRRLRRSDIAARWGGEEFVVALPNTTPASASTALRKLKEALALERFAEGDEAISGVSFSAGLSVLEADDDIDEALDRADRLLYRAKDAGRNRIFGPDDEVDGNRPRLLVAEDDADTARLIRTILETDGFAVRVARDGAQALELAKAELFEGILLDWNMPEFTGDEVLQSLREDARYAHTPIVMLTAVGDEPRITRAFALGADDYVQKPFRHRELIARVRRLMASDRRR